MPTLTPTTEPGAPRVVIFSVAPHLIGPADPVVVSWDIEGAEQVVIDKFGNVPPQGQREFRPEQTTDFRLVAQGGGKETIRVERVTVAQPTAPLPAPTEPPPAPTPRPTVVPPPTPAPPTSAPAPPLVPEPTLVLPPDAIRLIDLTDEAKW